MDFKIIVIYDPNSPHASYADKRIAPCMEVLSFSNIASYRRACDELKANLMYGVKYLPLYG